MAPPLRAGEAMTLRVGWDYEHHAGDRHPYRLVLWNEVTGYCEVTIPPSDGRISMTEGQLQRMTASPPSGQRWKR